MDNTMQFKVTVIFADFEANLEKKLERPLQDLEEEETELYGSPLPEAPYTGTARCSTTK